MFLAWFQWLMWLCFGGRPVRRDCRRVYQRGDLGNSERANRDPIDSPRLLRISAFAPPGRRRPASPIPVVLRFTSVPSSILHAPPQHDVAADLGRLSAPQLDRVKERPHGSAYN